LRLKLCAFSRCTFHISVSVSFLLFVFEVLADIYGVHKDTLQAERQDRVLDAHDAATLVERWKVHPGTRFWILTETDSPGASTEQTRFSQQLSQILETAGWTKDQRLSSTNPKFPLALYRSVTSRGIQIGYAATDPSSAQLAQSVITDLAEFGIASRPMPLSDIVPNAIYFWIGLQ
jgi:hypothetical protein